MEQNEVNEMNLFNILLCVLLLVFLSCQHEQSSKLVVTLLVNTSVR